MSSSSARSGFTLIEILVGLAVGLIAILTARAALGTLADQADRVTAAAADLDRVANGDRVMRSLLGRLEIGTELENGFGGDSLRAAFTTWCDTPAGWQERCRATLAVTPADSLGRVDILAAVLSTGEFIPLLSGPAPIRLLYLNDASNGGTWFPRWGLGITVPLALGVTVGRTDTLIIRIGERG